MLGLLLLVPLGAAAQEPVAVPSLRGNASAGLAVGSLGYRLGTLEIAREVEPGGLLSARLLIGSRPLMMCPPDDLHPDCGERASFAALLGGVQLAPSWKVVEPYVGVQVGFSLYDGPASVSSELLTVPQIGLRLRLGSFGGVYGDASYVLAGLPIWAGGFPVAGIGLYLSIPGS